MKMKPLNKLILSLMFGAIASISIYSYADDNNSIMLPTGGSSTIPVDDINNFAKVYALTKNYYVESVTDTKLMKGAINGMLTNLDPHSGYLDAKDFKALTEMTNGSFAGLGIEVSREKDDAVKVVAPIDGTPAYYAGIKSGDYIIKIDGNPVSDMTLDKAIQKMRGAPGTKVTLTISRKDDLKPLEVTITRAIIKIQSVKSTLLNKNYGYVRITNFQADTMDGLIDALNKLYKESPGLKGLVLDLRDDPGGLLQAAVGVVSSFVPHDSLVVYTKGRIANSSHKFYARSEDYALDEKDTNLVAKVPAIFKHIPIVVLVNQGTASASEIVSGALQDDKRAKIVGTKTFGKGSVQTVIPLSKDTAVKLTTALYFTPKGRSIQAEGIKPDIIVKSEYDDLTSSWDLSEASLNNHLSNPNTISVSKDKDNTPIIAPPQITTKAELKAKLKQRLAGVPKIEKQGVAHVDINNDFQLKWALNILEGLPLPKQNTTKIIAKATK